jgi:chorismate mutase
MTDPTVQRLREQISELDRSILEAVNARIELVATIRRQKQELGLPFVDSDRERQLLDDLVAANPGPLSEDGVRAHFSELLDLTKREIARNEGAAAA